MKSIKEWIKRDFWLILVCLIAILVCVSVLFRLGVERETAYANCEAVYKVRLAECNCPTQNVWMQDLNLSGLSPS